MSRYLNRKTRKIGLSRIKMVSKCTLRSKRASESITIVTSHNFKMDNMTVSDSGKTMYVGYFATDLNYEVRRNSNYRWVNSVGSIVG